VDELRRLGVDVYAADLVRLQGVRTGAKIRHDANSIAAVTIELAQARANESTVGVRGHSGGKLNI